VAGRAILGRALDRCRARSASRLVSPTRVVASPSTTPARTAAAAGAACAYAAVGRRCAGCTPAREASRSTPTGGRVCSASPTLPTLNHTSHTPPYPGPSGRRSFGAGLRLLAAILTLRSPACVPRSTSVPHYHTKGFPPAVNRGDFLNRIFWVEERHKALSEDARRSEGSASADHASSLRRARL
jgi:hypothetical protein